MVGYNKGYKKITLNNKRTLGILLFLRRPAETAFMPRQDYWSE